MDENAGMPMLSTHHGTLDRRQSSDQPVTHPEHPLHHIFLIDLEALIESTLPPLLTLGVHPV